MNSKILYESEIEQIALELLCDENGYNVLYGPTLLEGENSERVFTEVILQSRLRAALDRLNPHIPADAREDAFKQALRAPALTVIDNNETFHRLLTEGVDVKYSVGEGKSRTDKVWLVDFSEKGAERNEFLAVNQYTVVENNTNKRPDIVLFINGLPLVVIELKNATDENADVQAAFHQLQTYQQVIPSLFTTNAFLVISDGWFAKAGTISSDYARFMEWKSVDGARAVDSRQEPELEPLIKGLLNKKTLLDVIRHFIVFEKTKEKTLKKVAAYHQYFAVNKAIVSTIRASAHTGGRFVAEHPSVYGLPSVEHQPRGDQRAGVVWHTQGSGKSLSMVFYAGKLVLQEEMANPTLVVLTDRNDLDQQLFETFTNCQQLLRQTPAQAANREDLKRLLSVASGGIVFTTIQKFLPEGNGAKYPTLTLRRNVVVIADEDHRSQYDFIDGFAKHMRDALPNASFIGFTGTPIEKEDKNTQAVFGDYIDVYDIKQAVDDGATVRIYYESRLAKIELSAVDQKLLDERVEEVTEDDELTDRQRRLCQVGEQRGGGGQRQPPEAGRRRPRRALRAAPERDGRQRHDRLHESPHLRGAP
jgi:type I restriction enzyme, R subunit